MGRELDIEKLRGLWEAATPGKWRYRDDGHGVAVAVSWDPALDRGEPYGTVAWCGDNTSHNNHEANARFIVGIKAMLDELFAEEGAGE